MSYLHALLEIENENKNFTEPCTLSKYNEDTTAKGRSHILQKT